MDVCVKDECAADEIDIKIDRDFDFFVDECQEYGIDWKIPNADILLKIEKRIRGEIK